MTTFPDPSFTRDYQGLCNKVADTLNRQDLTAAIPDFVVLATSRIQRDMAAIRHPKSICRSQAECVNNYVSLPSDFIAVYQLMDQDAGNAIDYLSPEQTREILSKGWNAAAPVYYTLIGNTLRIIPAPGAEAPRNLDLWYYKQLSHLGSTNATNWALTRYPDLYLYAALVHSAPYLKADERIAIWDGAYQRIISDISIEADRATRPQSKLVSARRSF